VLIKYYASGSSVAVAKIDFGGVFLSTGIDQNNNIIKDFFKST